MLVVGDQAPYEDAAVSFTSSFLFFRSFYSKLQQSVVVPVCGH